MSNENLYLYILMRNDLPSMGAGRAAAQASHASNAFIHKFGDNADVKLWQAQTPQGFGTAIVLSANLFDIGTALIDSNTQGITISDRVTDPDYVITVPAEVIPCIDDRRIDKFEPSPTDPTKYLYHRSEVTCAYIFGDKEKLAPILSKFPLYS